MVYKDREGKGGEKRRKERGVVVYKGGVVKRSGFQGIERGEEEGERSGLWCSGDWVGKRSSVQRTEGIREAGRGL